MGGHARCVLADSIHLKMKAWDLYIAYSKPASLPGMVAHVFVLSQLSVD